jgi:hypothetical protein
MNCFDVFVKAELAYNKYYFVDRNKIQLEPPLLYCYTLLYQTSNTVPSCSL